MSLLGRLMLSLSADTAEFESDMGRAAHIAEREMERMATRAVAAGELIGKGISAGIRYLENLARETLKAGDELSKLATRTGFTVERLSELKFAGQLADVSLGQLSTGLGTFNDQLAKAQNEGGKTGEIFKQLGVDINAGPQKAFEQFLKAVSELSNVETKVATLRAILGRGLADAMLPFIDQLDEATRRAQRLGIVMSEKLAKDSERYNDAMTTLSATGNALLLPFMTRAAGGLATIAENMVTARERGTGFRDSMIEVGKYAVMLAGQLGSLVPWLGRYNEQAAQAAFNALEAQRVGTAVSGKIGAAPNAVMGPPDPADKQERVACAVSGGKWEGGRCVYKRASRGPKGRTPRDESERIARQLAEGDEHLAKDIAEAWSFVEPMNQRMKEYASLMHQLDFDDERVLGMSLEDLRTFKKEMLDAAEVLIYGADAATRAYAGFDENGRSLITTLKDSDAWLNRAGNDGNEFGLIMESAFERALEKGAKLRDVVNALGQDIAKMIGRKMITEPLGNAVSGLFSGGASLAIGRLSNLFSGTQAGAPVSDAVFSPNLVPQFAEGTPFVPNDGLAFLHRGEAVIPAEQNGRGGAPIVFNIDARGADAGAVARLEQNMNRLARSISGMVVDASRRGGPTNRFVGAK